MLLGKKINKWIGHKIHAPERLSETLQYKHMIMILCNFFLIAYCHTHACVKHSLIVHLLNLIVKHY